MRSRFVVAFVLTALASFVHGENCSTALITSLVSNPEFTPCTTDSGVSIATLTSTPTATQETSICKIDACLVLLRELLATNSTDCSIPTTGLLLQSQLIQPLFEACSAVTANESASGSDSSFSSASGSSLSVAGSSSGGDIDTASRSASTINQVTSASHSDGSSGASESTASDSSSSSPDTKSSAASSSSHASTGTNSTTTHKTSSKNSTGGSGSATKSDAAFFPRLIVTTTMAIVGVALWLA